jgi:pilus assembly protein Flp/PilA
VSYLFNKIWQLRLWKDSHGQDLIEYALLAGFVAVAGVATFPPIAGGISTIFSKIVSSMNVAISQS